MKFRNEDFDKQFKKYEILRANGTYQQPNDNRPESFRPRQDELQHVEWLDTSDNWQRRRTNLADLIGGTTMCDLLNQTRRGDGHPVAVTGPDQADDSRPSRLPTVNRGQRPRRRRSKRHRPRPVRHLA